MSPDAPNRHLLVVLPTWLGDAAMATSALRRLRDGLGPDVRITGLARRAVDQLLAGLGSLDAIIPVPVRGIREVPATARDLAERARAGNPFTDALLLRNSFSSALAVRLANIPRRLGYARDGRAWLLTDPVRAARTDAGRFAPVPAVDAYLTLVDRFLGVDGGERGRAVPPMELALTTEQEQRTREVLEAVGRPQRYAVLNPGANREDKRWPVERFARVAAHLIGEHGLRVLVNASPKEAELARALLEAVPRQVRDCVASLAERGPTIGSLKGVIRGASVLVTNDTGPRHIAAAFGVPTVALFGPTDPRWTTLPDGAGGGGEANGAGDGGGREAVIVADPTLPPDLVADEHPERCRIDRIEVERVIEGVDRVLGWGEGRGEGFGGRPERA